MTTYSFLSTGSLPSTMPITFSVEPFRLVTAVFRLSFFSAFSANESSFVFAVAPSKTCAPLSFSPWKRAVVSATPAVMVGHRRRSGGLELHDLVGRAVRSGTATAGVARTSRLSCWNDGIMMIAAAPFFGGVP